METSRAQATGKTWAVTSACHRNSQKDSEQSTGVLSHVCSGITLTAVFRKFCSGLLLVTHPYISSIAAQRCGGTPGRKLLQVRSNDDQEQGYCGRDH